MPSILPMHNPIQNYAWGSRSLLASFLGQAAPSNRPQAELWMGAHPQAPSQVWLQGDWQSLDQVIARDPKLMLGVRNRERFGPQLPFLFKVLAVEKPLSLQVHPNAQQAGTGFQEEESRAVPIRSPERNFKDQNPKPECLYALEPFWGLNGFRPPEHIAKWFSWLAPKALKAEIEILSSNPPQAALSAMLGSLLHMDNRRRQEVLGQIHRKVRSEPGAQKKDPVYWLAVLLEEYPEDIGVLAAVFLHLMHLQPGEAAFLPPGRLHAYLSGLGLELMANSDNVLRAGLTPKHVDVSELLRVLRFEHSPIKPLRAEPNEQGEARLEDMTEEFTLSVLDLGPESSRLRRLSSSIEILLCASGDLEVTDEQGGGQTRLTRGESVCIPACVSAWSISGQGRVFRACPGLE
ncbi:MAG: mannose-6-phosphate isomerase, class I [Desulfovermiculus sp.]